MRRKKAQMQACKRTYTVHRRRGGVYVVSKRPSRKVMKWKPCCVVTEASKKSTGNFYWLKTDTKLNGMQRDTPEIFLIENATTQRCGKYGRQRDFCFLDLGRGSLRWEQTQLSPLCRFFLHGCLFCPFCAKAPPTCRWKCYGEIKHGRRGRYNSGFSFEGERATPESNTTITAASPLPASPGIGCHQALWSRRFKQPD